MTTVVHHHHRRGRPQQQRRLWSAVVLFAAILSLPSTSPSDTPPSETPPSDTQPGPSPPPAAVQSLSGNRLWDDLIDKCDGPRNTMDCVRSRLYNYVEHAFDADLNITDGIKFTRNSNDYESVCHDDTAPAATGSHREARAAATAAAAAETENEVDDGWNDVTDELYKRGTKYLVTHDFEAVVPSFLGGGPGAKVRLSPKKVLPDGGIILRMDVLPAERDGRSARTHGFHKMLKQMFKKKLLTSGMALLLIIKLIKIKVIFLLPLLIGATAAKKILLKVLLFLFPPLAHLFKLCSYYHHHASKFYHFHHHKVKHHHHHLKIPLPVPIPGKPPHGYHNHGHGHSHSHGHKHGHGHGHGHGHVPDISEYYSGPTLDHPPSTYDSPDQLTGSEYYNRNSVDMNNVVSDHADELASWGLGDFTEDAAPSPYDAAKYSYSSSPAQYAQPSTKYSTPFDGINPDIKYGPPPDGPPPPIGYNKRIDDKDMSVVNRPPPQMTTHDPVYTPVVQKLDEIFLELNVHDEPCREKLVCKMYGDPAKFSPHSNLVSAQLSSDVAASSSGRTTASADASRLWRYVQAAKEGQNGDDCLVLYPRCTLIGL